MSLWTPDALASATGGRLLNAPGPVNGIAIDNREVVAGDLFLALKGENHDGHAFAAKALQAGAAAVMVHSTEGLPESAPTLLVDDTMAALQALGHAGRARFQGKVIGVTGSVGKTSTKDMLAAMLAGQGKTHSATRSFNNHWGVPLTLARMPEAADYAVIEIGMNHPGEITPLSRMAGLDVALITTVEAVHLAAFDSVEQIADAKAEIFAGLDAKGTAVLNADNPHFERLSAATAGHRIVAFGQAAEEFTLEDAQIAEQATVIRAQIRGAPLTFKIATPGVHFARNALGALACVEAVGADLVRAAMALAKWEPPKGRGTRTRIALGPAGTDGSFTLLDESYNANPASMSAALSVLAASEVIHDLGRVARGRRQAFLGDMLELGPTELELHAGLAAHEAIANIDRIHCCGPRMKALHDALPVDKRGIYCANSDDLAQQVGKAVDAGDVCMVKGSLGARMARVVESIRLLGEEIPAPDEVS
ncbi:MAG: UDP-N-acetylmuramoylalanyl-D-glutamyl-2,6-diaminopimelate--D-alanyl-D-alanine ligase [Pseudomonadota bacterium]